MPVQGSSSVFIGFSQWTSAHGVNQVGNARNCCVRTFWVVIFFVALIFFAIQVRSIANKYLERPVKVIAELKFENLEFPVITVCSNNPYKRSKLKEHSPDMHRLMNVYDALITGQSYNKTDDVFGLGRLTSNLERMSLTKTAMVLIAGQMSDPTMQKITYDFDDFIHVCIFSNSKCTESDFKKMFDPSYGACYQFNDNENISRKVNRSGANYGLKLHMVVSQDNPPGDYLPTVETTGSLLVVTGRNSYPHMDSYGIPAGAGYYTSVAVRAERTVRLKEEKYTHCVSSMPRKDYFYSGVYSTDCCLLSCRQKDVIEKCGCADPRLGVPLNAKMCTLAKLKCLHEFTIVANSRKAEQNLRECGCKPSCSELLYSPTVSQSVYPARNFKVAGPCTNTKRMADAGFFGENSAEKCRQFYRENALWVLIYYERMNVNNLVEKKAYTFDNVVSDFGGNIGLWLGCGVISMIEFIGLMLAMCVFCCARGNTQQRDFNDPLKKVE